MNHPRRGRGKQYKLPEIPILLLQVSFVIAVQNLAHLSINIALLTTHNAPNNEKLSLTIGRCVIREWKIEDSITVASYRFVESASAYSYGVKTLLLMETRLLYPSFDLSGEDGAGFGH